MRLWLQQHVLQWCTFFADATQSLLYHSFCGTEAYLAPEMILRLPYGASVDFWQYGCFVYELYAGRSPFWLPRKPRKFIRENILNGVFAYPSVVPEPAKGITGALLQVTNPCARHVGEVVFRTSRNLPYIVRVLSCWRIELGAGVHTWMHLV